MVKQQQLQQQLAKELFSPHIKIKIMKERIPLYKDEHDQLI